MAGNGGIEVEGLSAHYRSGAGVEGISLDVPLGSVVALVGGNGAGKSTVLDCVGTLRAFEAGTIRLGAFVLPQHTRRARARIGMAGQSTGLDRMLTVEQNLELFASLAGLPRRLKAARVDEVVAQLGLGPALDKRIGECSGGIQRRADLAVALLRRPDFLLLDEPTTGLDPVAREAFWRAVAAERERGAAVLFATQYLNEVSTLAESVALLRNGRMVEVAEPSELRQRVPRGRVHRLVLEPGEVERANKLLQSVAVVRRPDALSLVCVLHANATPTKLLARLEAEAIQPRSLSEEEATLDDVFCLMEHQGEQPEDVGGRSEIDKPAVLT